MVEFELFSGLNLSRIKSKLILNQRTTRKKLHISGKLVRGKLRLWVVFENTHGKDCSAFR
mgnify:CR=1 FL=1